MTEEKTAQQQLAEKNQEINLLYAKTFSTAVGQKCLDHLISTTIDQPVIQVSEGFSGIMIGYTREGQNALVRKIKTRVANANK